MQVLSCEVCKNALVMDSSGDFAICESCGMKYSKDYLISKYKNGQLTEVENIQKIELFEKVDAALMIGENPKKLLKQLIDDYPDDWHTWYKNAECLLKNIPDNDVTKELSSSTFWDYERKAKMLSDKSEGAFKELRLQYDLRYKKLFDEYEKQVIDKINNGEYVFEFLCLPDYITSAHVSYPVQKRFITVAGLPFISQSKENAEMLMAAIDERNLNDRLKLFVGITNFWKNEFEISDILYLSTKEAVVRYEKGGSSYVLKFNHDYTIEEILDYLTCTKTNEEQVKYEKENNICLNCHSELDEFFYCSNCKKIPKEYHAKAKVSLNTKFSNLNFEQRKKLLNIYHKTTGTKVYNKRNGALVDAEKYKMRNIEIHADTVDVIGVYITFNFERYRFSDKLNFKEYTLLEFGKKNGKDAKYFEDFRSVFKNL